MRERVCSRERARKRERERVRVRVREISSSPNRAQQCFVTIKSLLVLRMDAAEAKFVRKQN